MELSNAKAQTVWSIFSQLCRIPRPSRHEQQVAQWLGQFARDNNLDYHEDAAGNVVIELPATNGYEDSPCVIIQNHTDMVCEKTPESDHDFSKDAITMVEKDGWIYADNTTLGADNGLGISMAMALVLEKGLAHPRLELLFTVDEETGLNGVNSLERDFITGRRLINLDTEHDVFIVGCAGGEQTDIEMEMEWQRVPASFGCYVLKVSGLAGGHSGISIHEQRANAIALLTRAVCALKDRFELGIVRIQGGTAHNAIPRDGQATICFDPADLDQARQTLDELAVLLSREFSATDPDIKIGLDVADGCQCEQMWLKTVSERVVNLLTAVPHGVYRNSLEFDSMVETSNNLAVVETLSDQNTLRITTSQRSSLESSLQSLTGKINALARLAGARVQNSGKYPAWEPRMDSPLLGHCRNIYAQLYGEEPRVENIHAGLECSIIGSMFEDMDMVSFGPTIDNAHSPRERVNIQSVDKVWGFLLELLPTL